MLSLSEKHNINYVASICKITNLEPIPKADKLVKTIINGFDIVVSNSTKIGDVVVYFPIECEISDFVLSNLNLYGYSDKELNSNYDEYKHLLDSELSEEQISEIKSKCGFFSKQGRVRCINLRSQPSQGFILEFDKFNSLFDNKIELQQSLPVNFDRVGEKLICRKYVPVYEKSKNSGKGRQKNRLNKKLFDKVIPEFFNFHYDTSKLNNNIHMLTPDTSVYISKKIHGTSFICGNVLCNKKLSFFEKIKKFFGAKIQLEEYDNLYSSRRVIQNGKVDNTGYYKTEGKTSVYELANLYLKPYITEGMTIYGEAYGFTPTGQHIQKNHDYGATPNQTLFTVYRIVENEREWEIPEIQNFIKDLMSKDDFIKKNFRLLTIYYSGTLSLLYPELDVTNHWNEELLKKLKLEKRFFMEMRDPDCVNKVPAEGIVIRIKNDNLKRAFKLKTDAHYKLETKNLDEGIIDIENEN